MKHNKFPLLPLIAIAALLWPLPSLSSSITAAGNGSAGSGPAAATEAAASVNPAAAKDVAGSRLGAQEAYHRQLKAYEKAMDETTSDEERDELRHRFQEETREYRAFLAEQDLADRSRIRAEEIRFLQQGFDRERRQMKQDRDRGRQALDKERNELLSGVHENWPARVRALEMKKRQLDENYQKRLRQLEERYSRRLQGLN